MLTWSKRVKDLQSAGVTLEEIGLAVGLATSTVGDIGSGRTESPSGDAALALHELHRTRCKRAPAKRRSK